MPALPLLLSSEVTGIKVKLENQSVYYQFPLQLQELFEGDLEFVVEVGLGRMVAGLGRLEVG